MSKLTLIQKFILYITFLPEILPLIFCILFYKKLNTKALKVFFVYTIILFVFIGFNLLSRNVFKSNELHLFILRLFNICEYSIIALFLHYILKATFFRKLVLYSIIPFVLYAFGDYLMNDRSQFNNHSNIVSALLLIVFIVYFFYEKMNTVVMYPLYQSITFWICVGLLLYFAGSFFFFLFIKSSVDKVLMNSIYALVVIVKNILLCISLFASEKADDEDNALHIPKDLDLDELSLTNPKNL